MIGQRRPYEGDDRRKITPRLFIHIPKTAGTSLRSAAEICFGSSEVLRDYGPESADTSQSVKEHVYLGEGPTAIMHAIFEQQAKLVSGHFPLTKYKDVFCLADTATLVRNPVDQVVSHFQHMVRHYGHQGTLMDFARDPKYQNVQSQYVGMLDPALIGLVGLTESYRLFLEILKEQWDWNLPHRRQNVGNRLGIGKMKLSTEDRLEIECLNATDERLYRRASRVFTNRFKAHESGIFRDIRGGITRAIEGQDLAGWALDMCSPAPVTVDVVVEGECIASTACGQPLYEPSGWKLPGNGLGGFTIDKVALKEGHKVEIRDSEHGFILDSSQVLAAN